MANLETIGEMADRAKRLEELKLYVQSHPLEAAGWYMLHLEQVNARNASAADVARSRALALDPHVGRRFDAAVPTSEVPAGAPVVKGYRVLRVIHDGPSGTLYEATDEQSSQQRTLRVLKGERVESMREQLERQLVGVRYRGCVSAVDVVNAQDGRPVQVLTATFHPPLEAKPGKVPVVTARAAVAAIARVLVPIHADGLIAGDIRPGTVLGDLSDLTTIAVLGIRRAAGTTHGTLGGDPDRLIWFAPEEGSGKIDARVDVYGLGLLLWHLVTGERPPYLGKRLESGLPSCGDTALDGIIARATCTEPGERFADVGAFVEALTGNVATTTAPDGARCGDWILHERMGGGSVADVYAATHVSDGRRAAVKVFQHRGRFEREVRALKAVTHPGLVKMIEASTAEVAQPYIVFEKLKGETLTERIARGKLDVEVAVDVARQLARVLGALHAAGVVHRDVKPDNIIVADESGERVRVTLIDFDAAWIRDAPSLEDPDLTGTASHMAPEQWKLARDLDARTDVYALGLVLFECLYGRHPHGAENTLAGWRRAHCEAAAPPVPEREGLREHRRALIERMIDRDRAKRPASMDEVIVELDRERRRRVPLWVLVAIAGLLVAAGITVALFAFRRDGAATKADAMAPKADAMAPKVVEWCKVDGDQKGHARLVGDELVMADFGVGADSVKFRCDAWTGKTRNCHPIGRDDVTDPIVIEDLDGRGIKASDGAAPPTTIEFNEVCATPWP